MAGVYFVSIITANEGSNTLRIMKNWFPSCLWGWDSTGMPPEIWRHFYLWVKQLNPENDKHNTSAKLTIHTKRENKWPSLLGIVDFNFILRPYEFIHPSTFLLSLASMAIGMLFSIAIPSQLKATELLMVISTSAFILSGFTWPTMAIPSAITNVAQFIPLTEFLSGFRRIAFYCGIYHRSGRK